MLFRACVLEPGLTAAGCVANLERFMRSRKTRQLETIEKVVRDAGRPLAIAELHATAAQAIPGLGIATVYRAVRELAESGSIVSVTYAGQPTRFEWAVSRHHSHFICHTCKRVFDIDAPEKVPLPKKKPKGFTFDGDEVIYYGCCAGCCGKIAESQAPLAR